jgi:hypothetical protein
MRRERERLNGNVFLIPSSVRGQLYYPTAVGCRNRPNTEPNHSLPPLPRVLQTREKEREREVQGFATESRGNNGMPKTKATHLVFGGGDHPNTSG